MTVCKRRHLPAPRSPDEKTFLYQKRFIHLFKGTLILAHCSGDGIGPDRAAFEFGYDGTQDFIVDGIQSAFVSTESSPRLSI